MRYVILMLSCLALLTGCATGRIAPPPTKVECPKPPALDPPAKAVMDPSFIDQMQNFLSGKLPEQKSSEPASGSASPSTNR